MDIRAWLQKQAPDFVATFSRFPLAIALAAAATVVVIACINGFVEIRDETWVRLALGLATGAVCAVAGVFFRESRPEARVAGVALAYLFPILAAAAFLVTDIAWFVPWVLPVVSILWLSVSPFTRIGEGGDRDAQQDRFWWINQQAVASAAIGAAAFLLVALGIAAIERSLSILFGLETGRIFYEWVLPFAGLFLTPVYWLSTLPKVSGYPAAALDYPDFTSKAAGFLGQFVLVPLLLIYGVILLVYTVQIVVTQQLPQGLIGWMVTGFVVIGAATWLLLHPQFMRERALVRLFRRWWFWLTLVPLALFFVAVWVRVDAYGLTSERVLLVAGGIWATALAAAFLLGRGDIRLIPAFAGGILLLLSVGPWNYVNLPMQQQLLRLDAVVMNAGADKSASPPRPDWNAEEIAAARGIIDYLTGTREGQHAVRELMGKYGVTWAEGQDGSYFVLEALGVSVPSTEGVPRYATLFRNFDVPVDTSAMPYLLRPVGIYGNTTLEVPPLRFWAQDGALRVGAAGAPDAELVPLDLTSWLAAQSGDAITTPVIDLKVAERNFRLVVQSITVDYGENNAGPTLVNSIEAQLFSDRP